MRIAVFMSSFPVVSETFILRQITGLLDAGHAVHLFADTRTGDDVPRHEEIERYRLLERATFMDMPPECVPWEMPAWPCTGRTWLPGASAPLANWRRLLHALPRLARCALRSPAAAWHSINPAHYGYRARSLSALYRLDTLLRHPERYDVLHAHFGTVGESFRFARNLFRAPLLVSFHGFDFCTVPRKEGRDVYPPLRDHRCRDRE
jgi:colanic acid/amylovoran biosynthesis glycosyltransferase